MIELPKELALLRPLLVAFSEQTRKRFVVLALGAIIAMGRRTVSRVLWAVAPLARGHACGYHRFFSSARWSLWTLARVLAAMVLELTDRDKPLVLIVDDTVVGHRGKQVFGKGWHRDAVNSGPGHLGKKLGHKWVVMAVSVSLPRCKRPWALPVLAALYIVPPKLPETADGQVRRQAGRANPAMRPKGKKDAGAAATRQSRSKLPVLRKRDADGKLEPRFKSPCLLARQMLAVMIHWFPDRKFILLGDGGFASHDLALFCHRHRRHATLIARFCGDARLYARPDRLPKKRGRKRVKGLPLPAPQESVAAAEHLRQATLPWYGQRVRDVQMLGGSGGWYRCRGSGRGAMVPVRWVYVREMLHQGEAYLYSTDPNLADAAIATGFVGRWPIEVTFEEVRAHLGFATPRQRCKQSVLRTGPCLLGLFSLVSLIYAQLAAERPVKLQGTCCYAKTEPTFADALAAVRRVIWQQIILPRTAGGKLAAQLPHPLRELLLDHLTAAA